MAFPRDSGVAGGELVQGGVEGYLVREADVDEGGGGFGFCGVLPGLDKVFAREEVVGVPAGDVKGLGGLVGWGCGVLGWEVGHLSALLWRGSGVNEMRLRDEMR